MEAIIKFNLPEEQEDYDRMNKAADLCSFIYEFEQYLRTQWKYAEEPDDISTIYDKWFEMKNEEGIDLDAIYR